jgi:hypothetical protein
MTIPAPPGGGRRQRVAVARMDEFRGRSAAAPTRGSCVDELTFESGTCRTTDTYDCHCSSKLKAHLSVFYSLSRTGPGGGLIEARRDEIRVYASIKCRSSDHPRPAAVPAARRSRTRRSVCRLVARSLPSFFRREPHGSDDCGGVTLRRGPVRAWTQILATNLPDGSQQQRRVVVIIGATNGRALPRRVEAALAYLQHPANEAQHCSAPSRTSSPASLPIRFALRFDIRLESKKRAPPPMMNVGDDLDGTAVMSRSVFV